jgi:hypothetical protein
MFAGENFFVRSFPPHPFSRTFKNKEDARRFDSKMAGEFF